MTTHWSMCAILFMILALHAVEGETMDTSVNWSCPAGWSSLSDRQFECLWVSSKTDYKDNAQNECQTKGSKLVTILSEEKFNSVKNLMVKNRLSKTHLGLSVPNGYNRFVWQTASGYKEMEFRSTTLTYSRQYNAYNRYNQYTDGDKCGTMTSDGSWAKAGCLDEVLYYICEKPAVCTTGWYGPMCDRECHCYRYDKCDGPYGYWTCPYGCETGWMGPKCETKREKASVNYHCVNSVEGDKHVMIEIDTKGINYRIIEPLNDADQIVPWCLNTEYKKNPTSIRNMKIWLNDDSLREMDQGTCAGKNVGNDTYEWRITIQEWQGLLLPDDQDVVIRCNFTNGETLSRSGGASISGKYDIESTLVNETNEDVVLELVDAATKETLNASSVGTPVILKITFGLEKESRVKSVSPYNCEAISVNGNNTMLFIDTDGCPVKGTPVGTFSNSTINMTVSGNAIETQPFRYFTFHGDQHISFQCSFIFCFDTNCPVGCGIMEKWVNGTAFIRADRQELTENNDEWRRIKRNRRYSLF